MGSGSGKGRQLTGSLPTSVPRGEGVLDQPCGQAVLKTPHKFNGTEVEPESLRIRDPEGYLDPGVTGELPADVSVHWNQNTSPMAPEPASPAVARSTGTPASLRKCSHKYQPHSKERQCKALFQPPTRAPPSSSSRSVPATPSRSSVCDGALQLLLEPTIDPRHAKSRRWTVTTG